MGWLLLVVVLVIIWAAGASVSAAGKRTEEARIAYQDSLAELKLNPANPDLRQRTLELGRYYSNLMRDKKGNTLFDEVALMNDINAACAATLQVVPSQIPSSQVSSTELEDRLRILQGLRDKGLIDELEYTQKRSELLSQI
jgi:hypothetical protein